MSRKCFFCAFAVFFLILYLIICLSPASANDDDWDNLIATLSPENSVISKDVYTLEALKFDGYGMVLVQVSKNGEKLGEAVLENNSTAWCYLDNNNLRLKAYNVTDQKTLPMFGSLCSPEAEVVFETKKYAEDNVALELDLDTDKDEYLLDDEVIVEMELRNTGEVKTDKIKLDVDSDGLLVKEGVPESIMLDKGSKKSSELRFRFPDKIKETYNITVKANWEDSSGEHSLSKAVEIEPLEPLEIYKNTGSEAFSGDPVYVTVSVKNIQKRAVNVSLLDLPPATFTIINSSVSGSELSGSEEIYSENPDYLSRDFVLAPEEKKTFSYSMKSEQLGAHRVPQVHAYSNLCGQLYTECSDSENIVTVYENISYLPYSNETLTEVTLASGADLSAYLDKNGYALLDIQIENKALDASLFIPKGTRLLDSQEEPLKAITISEATQPSLPESLLLAGKCYGLEPEGAEFEPFATLKLSLNTSIEGNFPAIYCYEEKSSGWTQTNSTVNENRISADISAFSIYAVLAEAPAEVTLKVNIVSP
jgi:hypothetical protein